MNTCQFDFNPSSSNGYNALSDTITVNEIVKSDGIDWLNNRVASWNLGERKYDYETNICCLKKRFSISGIIRVINFFRTCLSFFPPLT